MGKKGGGGSTTTVQKADPWAGQQPYLQDIFQQAQQLYNAGGMAPNYYPGQTVADQSKWTQDALQMQADRAQNGSPLIDNASNAMNNITMGQALQNNQGLNVLNQLSQEDNPYVDELYNRANSQAQSAINGNFSAAGRYGSGAHAAASADAANNLANEMYGSLWDKRADAAASAGQLYNTGIGQQVVAGQAGQQLANQAYTDAAALGQAGAAMDDYNQQKINADIDRYNYNQQQALLALQNYNNLIQGSYGGTTTTTGQQNSGGSTFGNVLGGALAGGGIGYGLAAGSTLGGPIGAGIGALAGGLLGLF